jgi:K+-transporting ATPase ATPase C chain
MKTEIIRSLLLTLACLFLFTGIYSGIVWCVAQLAPGSGKGRMLEINGKTSGYENIGQSFLSDRYFWSRPSFVNYNAAGSGGSNKGPSDSVYLKVVQARIDTFLVHNPDVKRGEIPSDLVTASGSGLDPHISVQAANIQVKRIARKRGISEQKIRQLVAAHTESPWLGFLGMERINVLLLNADLDKIK